MEPPGTLRRRAPRPARRTLSPPRLLGLTIALTACKAATLAPAAAPTVAAAQTAVTDALVDVGGLSLHIHCAGEGTPVVVLDAGLGDDGTVWNEVLPDLSRVTRTCAYDRAGTGSSSAAPRPHTSRQMVEELHTLLVRAKVPGPYVLVGHSLGGLNVRLYTSQYQTDVAGMVLIDAATEHQDSRFWTLIPEEPMRVFRASLADHPEGLDFESFRASMAAVRDAKRSLGDMPLVVLTHGKEDPPPPGVSADLAAQMARVWQEMQSDLPRLSSNSVHVIAEKSGHYIHAAAPRLTVAAVQEVVRAARAHARVDGDSMSPERVR